MGDKGKVVDISRVRYALARLEEHLEAHPELKCERTAAFLAGELEGADEPRGEDMAQKVVKIPEDLFNRAAALAERMAEAPELVAASRKGAAAVIRVALDMGLQRLERKYAPNDEE